MTAKDTQTVASKVMKVIQHWHSENPGQLLSISKIAKLAKVSRSNLYESHLDIIAKIKSFNDEAPVINNTKKTITNRNLQEKIIELTKQNRALVYICIEQKRLIESLKKDVKRLSESR